MKTQKDTFKIETISEDLREPSTSEEDFSEIRKSSVTFKKVFKGFDEAEVLKYIEDQEGAYKQACSMYDRTIEDSKSENALLRRENKALKQTISELEDRIKELEEAAATAEQDKADAIAAALAAAAPAQPEPEAAADEFEVVEPVADYAQPEELAEPEFIASPEFAAEPAAEQEQDDTVASAVADATILRLEAEVGEYTKKVSELQQQLDSTAAELAEKESTIDFLSAEVEQVQILKNDKADLAERIASISEELNSKTIAYERAVTELEQFKRDAKDSVVKAQVYSEQADKLSAEISELRAVNQKQAYDYAERLSTLEATTSADRAKVSQQMKMHSYHLAQIDDLLSQVTEQFELAKQAVDKID